MLKFILFGFLSAYLNTAPVGEYIGTGFFINDNGYLITCSHVVVHPKALEVNYNNRWYPAKVIANNSQMDVAILKIQAKTPYLPLNIEAFVAQEGESYGFPDPDRFGWSMKETRGWVSQNSDWTYTRSRICPGNSGGPIVTTQGVVGIVSENYFPDDWECSHHGRGPTSQQIINLLNLYNVPYYVSSKIDTHAVVLIEN